LKRVMVMRSGIRIPFAFHSAILTLYGTTYLTLSNGEGYAALYMPV
jgi:hypothetical protein